MDFEADGREIHEAVTRAVAEVNELLPGRGVNDQFFYAPSFEVALCAHGDAETRLHLTSAAAPRQR